MQLFKKGGKEMDDLIARLEKIRGECKVIAKERKQKIASLGADQFIGHRREIIKKFAINRLAQILFECVECDEKTRDLIDWFTAEDFIKRTFTESMWDELIIRDIVLRSYDFQRKAEPSLHEIGFNIIANTWEGIAEYFRIVNYFVKLPFILRFQFFQKAALSEDRMYDYIGRIVWDWGYQEIN